VLGVALWLRWASSGPLVMPGLSPMPAVTGAAPGC
jgi:hypothetical protein